MKMSDKIESFITELLKAESDSSWVELRRNELASIFSCAPSQINYVIATRFGPDNGYAVESKRGGGGYLRIRRINTESEDPIYSVLSILPESIDFTAAAKHIKTLFNENALDLKTANMLLAAVSDNSLTIAQPYKDKIRANILKNTLASLI